MLKIFHFLILILPFLYCKTSAQTTSDLKSKIEKIISNTNTTVGVSVTDENGQNKLSINGNKRFPLQSVFKFHIALVVLSQIDEGKLSLKQKVKIEKKELLPELYSPIKDKYPKGTTLSISEILEYTVSQSDNIGCDILLKLIGGPQVVEEYLHNNNIKDVSIKINEEVQQSDWNLQFKNWTTPASASKVLSTFYKNNLKQLSEKSYDFLWKTMKGTDTGKERIKGQLPKNTVVAHKTGTSGVNKKGVTGAVNDIGIVFLPDGKYYFISVFISQSKENNYINEKLIADISKVTWDYFTKKSNN